VEHHAASFTPILLEVTAFIAFDHGLIVLQLALLDFFRMLSAQT